MGRAVPSVLGDGTAVARGRHLCSSHVRRFLDGVRQPRWGPRVAVCEGTRLPSMFPVDELGCLDLLSDFRRVLVPEQGGCIAGARRAFPSLCFPNSLENSRQPNGTSDSYWTEVSADALPSSTIHTPRLTPRSGFSLDIIPGPLDVRARASLESLHGVLWAQQFIGQERFPELHFAPAHARGRAQQAQADVRPE